MFSSGIISVMFINIISYIFGLLIFLFIFWKRLKEDYASEIIFRTSFYILFGLFGGCILSIQFLPNWFWWFEFFGAILGLLISIKILGIRFYETLETFVISSLPLIAIFFLIDSVATSSFGSFVAFLTTLLLIFGYYFLDSHYKNFTWYKSGKIGFSGLTTLGFIFIIRSSLALFGVHVLSFVDKFEGIISGTLAIVCFLLVFNLGRVTK